MRAEQILRCTEQQAEIKAFLYPNTALVKQSTKSLKEIKAEGVLRSYKVHKNRCIEQLSYYSLEGIIIRLKKKTLVVVLLAIISFLWNAVLYVLFYYQS